jgi:hypothetical protein
VRRVDLGPCAGLLHEHDPDRCVVVLPGMQYSTQAPLLWYARSVAAARAADRRLGGRDVGARRARRPRAARGRPARQARPQRPGDPIASLAALRAVTERIDRFLADLAA